MATEISLRPPAVAGKEQAPFHAPSTDWLKGEWFVTHSSLPLWKNKKNVIIKYTPLPPEKGGITHGTDLLDDLVSYQKIGSEKVQTVHGLDRVSGDDAGAWDWRGLGMMRIASTHWEILGYGALVRPGEDGTLVYATQVPKPEDWVVTFFQKTIFTPAGIDLYFRSPTAVTPDVVDGVKAALAKMEHDVARKLAGDLFEIPHDRAEKPAET
ncbi:MAG: hypothetical protein M1825_001471 [Sarcosagium campestre]|nr:MAG: hypothetical protein M1825_001471 [Sarcosagium campestre]